MKTILIAFLARADAWIERPASVIEKHALIIGVVSLALMLAGWAGAA